MDEELASADASMSFQCPSPSELDKGFLDQSLSASALSLMGQSTSVRPPNRIVVEYYGSTQSLLASLCQSPNPVSPSQAMNLNSKEATQTPGLTIPVESKSSTPAEQVLLQKPKLACPLDLSYIDLTASQVAWEVSLIKPETNSPKPILESSTLETTWSPKFQSAPPSLAEISLIWSGSPPHGNDTEDNQRSWKEVTMGSSLSSSLSQTSGSASAAEDEWHRRTAIPTGFDKPKWGCDSAVLKS
ncbi:uncharacterized protein si:ch73-303b9.1 [Oncorhynchus tshawytscha]|uniref:uncharacterized protein si:ch73-303b9.1 n=1 Tax=Oncorhynchus tshawytscha TaxID=74940 RepID=UPI000D0A3212|nr:uncharacterized protein si:ch73-303b9.1 [Oncorhynchus tshawytscha]